MIFASWRGSRSIMLTNWKPETIIPYGILSIHFPGLEPESPEGQRVKPRRTWAVDAYDTPTTNQYSVQCCPHLYLRTASGSLILGKLQERSSPGVLDIFAPSPPIHLRYLTRSSSRVRGQGLSVRRFSNHDRPQKACRVPFERLQQTGHHSCRFWFHGRLLLPCANWHEAFQQKSD